LFLVSIIFADSSLRIRTFDDVEIHPNPQLNVIVGPNGTGKSSIVCAMCLGLGGRTNLLGRAKEIKDFIKHGKMEGFVEIELYDPRGKNPIIRRHLNIRDNSSTWLINGRTVQLKEVTKLVQDMRIQLDNKCQFLPQVKAGHPWLIHTDNTAMITIA